MLLHIKFYWDTEMLVHLHIVYVCFHIGLEELSHCNRDLIALKAKSNNYMALYRNVCQSLSMMW